MKRTPHRIPRYTHLAHGRKGERESLDKNEAEWAEKGEIIKEESHAAERSMHSGPGFKGGTFDNSA